MTTKFNQDNTGYENGYPLFFGQPLGVLDTINVSYPELEQLYQDQLAQIWNEFEVDLTQDKQDMMEVDKGVVDLMVKTLMWQTVADSVASRSISDVLGEYITNSELQNLTTVWSFFEVIHARTYSHIIKQTFVDPNELLKDIYDDLHVLTRSDVIIEAFDRLSKVDQTDNMAARKGVLMALVALFSLEAIAFMASFATTFAVVETGKFQGIGKLVQLICRDEVLHSRMGHTILTILKKDPYWAAALYECQTDIHTLLDTIVANEKIWAEYVFEDGRGVLGLSPELLKRYVDYMAAPVYATFGIEKEREKTNPLPYMEKYIDPSKIQTANMELQNSSYLIGAITDDTADLDLGDLAV